MFKYFPKTATQKTGYLVFLPDDPDGSIQFFIHGIGQIYDGSLKALIGILDFINNNWPTGHWVEQLSKRRTIVIFPNLIDSSWTLDYMDDALKFAEQFSFDRTKMHLACHSLGGQLIWGYTGSSPERGKMFASIIAIAPVYVQTNYSNIKSPVRIYVSQNDSLYQQGKSAWNQLMAAKPPLLPELIPTGSDHNICGLVFDNEETWEWMLSKSTGSIPITPPTPIPIPTPTPSPLKADASQTLSNILGTFAVLDGSKSVGYKRAAWEWISGPEWNVFPNFNKEGITKQINNLKPGKYKFALNVWDDKGNKSSDNVDLSVQAAKKIFEETMINGEKIILFEDNTWAKG